MYILKYNLLLHGLYKKDIICMNAIFHKKNNRLNMLAFPQYVLCDTKMRCIQLYNTEIDHFILIIYIYNNQVIALSLIMHTLPLHIFVCSLLISKRYCKLYIVVYQCLFVYLYTQAHWTIMICKYMLCDVFDTLFVYIGQRTAI